MGGHFGFVAVSIASSAVSIPPMICHQPDGAGVIVLETLIAMSLPCVAGASLFGSRFELAFHPLTFGEVNPRRAFASCCACETQYRILDSVLISSSLWRSPCI